MTILTLLLYLLILIVIAYRSYRKAGNHLDFFIAHKKGNFRSISGSLVATILGGSAVIGAVDAGKQLGWAIMWYMLAAAIGLFALLPLVKRVSKLGRFTLPDLLEDLYGKQSKNVASFIIPVAWIGIVAAQVIAAAKILQSFTGINYETGVIISGVVFVSYTMVGGQVSVLKTDFFQAILILIGLALLSYFSISTISLPKLSSFELSMPFNAHFSPVDLVVLLFTYASTFTAGPDIFSRIFCAESEQTAKKAVLTTAAILIPVSILIGIIGVASATYLDQVNGAAIIELSKAILPAWSIPIVVLALLSSVLSSADTTLLSSSIIVTDRILKSNFSAKTINTTRLIIGISGLMAVIIALNFTSVIGMLLVALTIYSGAFIVPILVGLTGLKVKPIYTSVAIIFGGTIALVGKILTFTSFSNWSDAIIILAFFLNGIILFLGARKK